MAQVKNEEEKKKETTKRVTKKTTTPEKVTSNSKNKTTSKSTREATTKKQTTAKKSTTTKKTKTAKEPEKIAKNESEDIRKVKGENPKKEVKKRSSKKETTNEKDAKKKTTTKTKKSVTQKAKTSKNTKSAKGKITKIIGSRNQEEIEDDDVVITDAKETDVVKIDDEEKMQLVENEVKKDLKSKNKLPKTEERKLSSVVFENLCVAIAVMIYLFFIILGFINIKEEVYVVDLKVFSFIILVIAILLFERAYKKDSGKLCAFGIEVLFLSITTMGLLYANIEINNIFLPVAATVSLLFAIYYVAKSIYLYTKMKKSYFVDNMKDIIKKEEKE